MNIKPSSLIIHNPCGIRCFQTKFAFYLAEFDKRANSILLGPAVRRPISSSSRLNFNLGFFIPLYKSLFGIIFCVLWRASNSNEFLLKLSDLKSDFTLTLAYLNPALNNPALANTIKLIHFFRFHWQVMIFCIVVTSYILVL